jgi:phosphoglycolate phosphatase-like HAD superfamily hydrolase
MISTHPGSAGSTMRLLTVGLLALIGFLPANRAAEPADPLPSWNDTGTKKAILAFVDKVTAKHSTEFVPASERIAVFDNDGTLWSEQPMYVELAFTLDRVKAMAPDHPEWKAKQPFKAVLEDDHKTLAEAGEKGMIELFVATHSGMTTDEFAKSVTDWLATAKHPKYKRPYTQCVYQPMLELLKFLREREFKTFIVSGGTVDFMRPWTESVYGIPPEQVVGTAFKKKYDVRNGKPEIVLVPELDFIDDSAGKPVGISKSIGRRPLMAFGNSDGDLQMLEYTTTGSGSRFGLIVHHTDAEREVAYDRKSTFGRLNRGLDEAPKRGWTVVDMKDDWKTVFASSGNPK